MSNENVNEAAALLKANPKAFMPNRVNEGTEVLARMHEHIPTLTLEELDAACLKNLLEHPDCRRADD